MLNISEKLKALRKSHNYTIQTVADGIGIAVRTYQNYEYGQREISSEALFKLADFYHVTTDYLLGRDTATPEPLDELERDFNMSALERKILDNYISLPPNMRTDLMDFLYKAVKEVEEESGN